MQDRVDHGGFEDAPAYDDDEPGEGADGPPGISMEAFWALVDPDHAARDA